MKHSDQHHRYAGDKADVALELFLHPDPDSNSPVSEEDRASWGYFRLWLGGQNVCTHLESGEEEDAVHWYLLPLLEWLAQQWDPLHHEERLPIENAGQTAFGSCAKVELKAYKSEHAADQADNVISNWWRRHNIRAARNGGIFPDLYIRRLRDEIEFSWGSTPLSGMPPYFKFMSPHGVHRTDPGRVAHVLYEVLESTTCFLSQRLPASRRLTNLSRAVNRLRGDGQDRRVRWLAGLGDTVRQINTRWAATKDQLETLGARKLAVLLKSENDDLVVLGSSHAALMFGSVAPKISSNDRLILAKQIVDSTSSSGDSTKLRRLICTVPIGDPSNEPWAQGYELAENAINEQRLINGADFVDIDRLVKELEIEVVEIRLSDKSIRGVAIAGSNHRPRILLNTRHATNQYPSGRRFSIAHELCHILFDRTKGQRLSMASGPWAPRGIEQRANAFAAMLLMPTELVRRTVASLHEPVVVLDGLTSFCHSMQVSHEAARRHLRNLGFMDEEEMEELQAEVYMDLALREERKG